MAFGCEATGLGEAYLVEFPCERRLHIPMRPSNRSLNLANAVSVVAYEAWRQRDLDMVKSAEFRQFLKEQGFVLVTWKELAKAPRR